MTCGDDEQARLLLEAAFESSSDGLSLVDLAGHIVYCNSSMLAIWKMTPEMLVSGNHTETLQHCSGQLVNSEDFLPRVRRYYAQPDLEGVDILEFRDGRMVERRTRPQRSNGAIIGRLWTLRDVTDRMRAESALRESVTRLELAIEATEECIWDIDVLARTVSFTAEGATWLGLAPTDTSHSFEAWRERMHPQDRDAAFQNLHDHLEGRAPRHDSEYRIRDAEGEWRWLQSRGKIVTRTVAGAPARLIGTLREISELKRVDIALRELVNGTASVTGESFFMACVQHLANALGTRYAFIGQLHADLSNQVTILAACDHGTPLPTNVVSLPGTPCERVYENGFFAQASDLAALFPAYTTPAGGRVEGFIGIALRTGAGNVIGHLGAMHDYPLRDMDRARSIMRIFAARATAELERLLAEVALTASERKRRMALEKARDSAVASARMKSEFLATVSHELRTPLHGSLTMLELLRATQLNSQQTDYVSTIQECGHSLLLLIDDIIDLSKIESDGTLPPAAEFDPRQTVREVVSLLMANARTRDLRLELEEAPELPNLLTGYERPLRQVIFNLVANAIKFTQVGHVIIRLGGRPSRLPGRWDLSVRVEDTGIGIPPHLHTRIFQPFTQLDSSDTRRYSGTGLGLAICQRLCEKMGAIIYLESILEKGSIFTVESPGMAVSRDETRPMVSRSGQFRIDRVLGQRHPLRILVAEDNRVNRRVAQLILERMGYETDIAENGVQVLERLRHATYDLIFMDLQMPEMDGVEATRRIIELYPEARRPTIIGISANAMTRDRQRSLDAGMKDFLTKPVSVARIANALIQCPRLPETDT